MNFIKKKLSFLVITLTQISPVFAYPEFSYYLNNGSGMIDISGPADQEQFGKVVYNSGSSDYRICNSSDVNYTLASIVYESLGTWTGRTYQATSAHPIIPLFESGIVGVSLTPMGGPFDQGYPANWSPMGTETKTVWSGYKENGYRIANGYRAQTGVYVYKDEQRFSGSTVIPQQRMYRYLCKDTNGTTQEVYNFDFRPINMLGTVTGCTPTNSAVVLDMNKIAESTIKNADSSTLIGTKNSMFSLQCDPNIKVFVSFVDLSDQTNSTEISKLTSDSTAKGVGFAVTGPTGKRLRFGPDGSAKDVPGQEKYYIQNSGSASASRNNPISTQFGFSYVRNPNEEVKPGTAKAVIGLTYSYQ